MTQPGHTIVAEGLTKLYGDTRALDGFDLTVPRGMVYGLLGPNGAGKTTLFNMISGIYKPTAGTIMLGERDITADSIHQRARAGVGRTFQTSNLFPGLSVLENVRLAAQRELGGNLSVLKFPRWGDEATTVARAHLAEVGLSGLLDVPAGGLSHGDKRKLEIAVLLAMRPTVILLDEPMAGVSRADVPGLSEVIRRIHRDHEATVLMVEHHIDVVMDLVERVAVLHQGEILALDAPEVIVDDPAVQNAYLGAAA